MLYLSKNMELSARPFGPTGATGRHPRRRGRGARPQVELPSPAEFGGTDPARNTAIVVFRGGQVGRLLPFGAAVSVDSRLRLAGVVLASVSAGYNTTDEGEDDAGTHVSVVLIAGAREARLWWSNTLTGEPWRLAGVEGEGLVLDGLTLEDVWTALGVFGPDPFQPVPAAGDQAAELLSGFPEDE